MKERLSNALLNTFMWTFPLILLIFNNCYLTLLAISTVAFMVLFKVIEASERCE